MNARELVRQLKATGLGWYEGETFHLGAALAYYSVFSIAPILMVAVGIAGVLFGREAAEGLLIDRLTEVLGPTVAEAIVKTLSFAHTTGSGWRATVVGTVILIVAAISVFLELQTALNKIWQVAPKPGRGLWGVIHDRLLSFLMVLVIGLLLILALVANTTLSALSAYLPDSEWTGGHVVWEVYRWTISLLLLTLLFALVYKLLPDAKISWQCVWVGAAVTAVLFALGNFLISLYLAHSNVATVYGAAGSLVVILLWVYYASQILLFGAEFTKVYADRRCISPAPADNAIRVPVQRR
jgi:membrane protein